MIDPPLPALPSLHVTVAGQRWTTVEPPSDFGGREWLLGVVAIQAFWAPGEGLSARVRAHKTGEPKAHERPLGHGEPVIVRIAVGDDTGPEAADGVVSTVAMGDVSSKMHTAQGLGMTAGPASLAVYRGGKLLARADLPEGVGTPLRAFGHVFVRWRREAPPETGVDLTGFAPPGSAEMYGRLRSEALPIGVPVTYVLDFGVEGASR